MEIEELKILLAIEPTWTVSRNDFEFLTIPAEEISAAPPCRIQLGKWIRDIETMEWLRPNVVRIRSRQTSRRQSESFVLYPGEKLPSSAALRRRRRSFQSELGKTLGRYFQTRSIQRQTLFSDRRYGIGGAYPRFIIGDQAVIAVDTDEAAPTVNGIMRAALLWAPLVRRKVSVLVPRDRAHTIRCRLEAMPAVRQMFRWLEWDGQEIAPLTSVPSPVMTEVHDFSMPDVTREVARVIASTPLRLQPVMNIAGRSISIHFRGIEVALVQDGLTSYPLGEPLAQVVQELDILRRHGSSHPLSRAHEERWLESNLIAEMSRVLPSIDPAHIYPQVPSFGGEERNIIDLLAVTTDGRLVVMEIKASADPDLPFQALDYWIAVERHRKAGDFERKGYFKGVSLREQPALLVLVAPLLAFHKTLGRMVSMFPREVPLVQIGLNQTWKREIQILRRRGLVG